MNRFFRHFLFWTTYVLLNGVLTGINFDQFDEGVFLAELLSLPSKILLTYYIMYVVLPYFFQKRNIWKTFFLVTLGTIFAVLLYRLILYFIIFPALFPQREIHFFNTLGFVQSLFDLFITTAAAVAIKLTRMQLRNLEHEAKLKEEKLASELKFLRTQTNPHFLFNTLNNIYVLAWKKSANTADAVMMLSKIMRFMLYDCRKQRIRLQEETKVIQDFIQLEKLRYTDRLNVRYEEAIDQPDTKIAPLLLLPFVENAFKHGAHATEKEAHIRIRVVLHEHQLVFTVSNTLNTKQDSPEPIDSWPKDGGIGLKNVQRQLDLVYPGRYSLFTGPNAQNDLYLVQLEIQLNGAGTLPGNSMFKAENR